MNSPLPTASELFGAAPEDVVSFRAADGRYVFGALGGAIEFIVDHLRRERHSLIGEIEVRCSLAGAKTYGDDGTTVLISSLNFTNTRARQELAGFLTSRARTTDVQWLDYLENCTQRIWAAERQGSPAIPLHQIERPSVDAVIDVFGLRILHHHPQIVFSPGGTGKSLFASAIVGELGKRGIRTLLLDWEMDGGEQRLRADALGLPPTIWYRRCDQPLVFLMDSIRRDVVEHKIGFLLIDSVAPACSGRVEESDVAIDFFKAWRRIGCGGLAIAHTRAEEGEQRPFGSVFWSNLARSTWFLKRVNEVANPKAITLGVYQRKANFSSLKPAFGVEIKLDAPDDVLEMVTVRRTDITEVAELAAGLPLWQRLRHALRHGPKTIRELAEELDAKPNTVGKTLGRGDGRSFTLLANSDDGVQRWALLESRVS